MRGYRSEPATRRHSATLSLCAAMPAIQAKSLGLSLDRVEGTSVAFGNHQWQPTARMEPPVQ